MSESSGNLKQIRRVLVANRGEIAVRIIRACKELGIETVQAYSVADRDSLAVKMADAAVCIGPSPASASYLNSKFIVSAALSNKVDAIHPGYGFLSEKPELAEQCAKNNLIFVGPDADIIRLMGDKVMARNLATEAGIPVTPGSKDAVTSAEVGKQIAKKIGYPILLKAAAGGGGKGMRVVRNESEMESSLADAQREAKAAFKDGTIYIEKYFEKIRHIEIQILGDSQKVLSFGERDCSIQRRHQKLVEESPAPSLKKDIRKRINDAAVRLCKRVGYKGAGTVEFILDESDGEFYFIEMNTRIQVEHPVTEMVTGFDLVKAQLQIASGITIPLTQKDITFHGHAIECRINAEDPRRGFSPCPGRITDFQLPGGAGVRVDSHIFTGYVVPPYYDSLLAKVICWGQDRDEALSRLRRALGELVIEGVTTTASFHKELLIQHEFSRGEFDTNYINREFQE